MEYEKLETEAEYSFSALGPYPWNAVAEHAQQSLVVHHWVWLSLYKIKSFTLLHQGGYYSDKNEKDNPSKHASLGKRLVDPEGVKSVVAMKAIDAFIKVGYMELRTPSNNWASVKAHQKMAYAKDSNLFCIGDANHVVEHVHHAGIVVISSCTMCLPVITIG